MLPEGTLASSVSPTTYNIGDIAPRQNLLEDFELGGVALNDSSQGRYTQRWKGWYDSGNIYLNNEADATSILVNSGLSNVLEVSITFDGSMAPVIAYLVGTTTNLYWYDAIIPGYTTLSYSGCTSPMLCYDDKRESETTNSDIMLFYIRNGGIYYRQQRDRFTIEYTLIASVPSGRIMNVGMNLENRLQLTYKKDIGTIISTNTIKAELHPKNTSNLDTSTSIASAYLNFTNCASQDETGEFCGNLGEGAWQGKNGTVWSVNGFTNPNGETSIESYFSVKQQDNINFEVELKIEEYSEPGVPIVTPPPPYWPPEDPWVPPPIEDPILPDPYVPSYMWPVITGDYTASAGEKLWASSEVPSFTITLPATPSPGDDIWIWHPELGYTITPLLYILAIPNRVCGVLHGVDTVWTELEYFGGYIRCTYINESYGWNILNGTWQGL